MANINVIAKPYAKAAFEFANEYNIIDQWLSEFKIFVNFLKDDASVNIIKSPMLSQSEIVYIFKDKLDKNFINFLYIVAENKRLQQLPNIVLQFEELNNDKLNNRLAIVTLAYEADSKLLEVLRLNLEKKFNCYITLSVNVNPAIIGGVIVKIGDTVIDGSVTGRVEKMKGTLLS